MLFVVFEALNDVHGALLEVWLRSPTAELGRNPRVEMVSGGELGEVPKSQPQSQE